MLSAHEAVGTVYLHRHHIAACEYLHRHHIELRRCLLLLLHPLVHVIIIIIVLRGRLHKLGQLDEFLCVALKIRLNRVVARRRRRGRP